MSVAQIETLTKPEVLAQPIEATVIFGDSPVSIRSAANGHRINILDQLRNPADFLANGGKPDVHHYVNFGQTFAPLIGRAVFDENFRDKDRLAAQGVVSLADHYQAAGQLVKEVNTAAGALINDNALYDDPSFCRYYFDLAKIGYAMLAEHEHEFFTNGFRRTPVSLVRAGLVSTRLAAGLSQDAIIKDEVQVVTKRVHPKDGMHTDLSVTVTWVDPSQVTRLNGASIEVADFVNPASGASTAALVLAANERGSKPKHVMHRSIMATEQGISFMQKALGELDVQSGFYTLGTSPEMNDMYYLRNPGVGDAGHALRHFLPYWSRNGSKPA